MSFTAKIGQKWLRLVMKNADFSSLIRKFLKTTVKTGYMHSRSSFSLF